MRKKHTFDTIVKIVVWVVLAALLLGFVSFIARYTNNFTSDFKTFYVKFGDKTIMNDTAEVCIEKEVEYRFDVSYSLGFLSKATNSDFQVQIKPNITKEAEFEFTVDDEKCSYSDIKDLTAYFNVKCYDGYFTLVADKDLSMILQSMYPEKTLEGVPQALDSGKDYFLLEIANQDKSTRINIAFRLVSSYIDLTPDQIVF